MTAHSEQRATFDHLVFASRDLTSGMDWVETHLGMRPTPGGEHGYFGTHNALLPFQRGYLEVIAINPAAPQPTHPRWFELDTPAMHERLRSGPALIHWVAGVTSIERAVRRSTEDHGDVLALSRGTNRWQLTVPPDGSLPMQGVLPSLIQWESLAPNARPPGSDMTLERLHLRTPHPERLHAALDALGFIGTPLDVTQGNTALRATFQTAGGPVTLP